MNATSKALTKMTHDVQTQSEGFTTLMEQLCRSTNTFILIETHCGLKAPSNKDVNVEHEVSDHLGHLSVGDSLPNDVKVTAKNATKLGVTIATIVKMQMVTNPICIHKSAEKSFQ